ncbi:MAG: CDP-glucose 4,6-dehydratase [Pseudomonadales bacterium]|nr:CDP-glucose 4,6-dehydratase [Pseudomonadales bacterium]MCP5184592.1 CDP-glucose 4,6-dehydratase [Pseudomonadales bacterium]
MFLDYYRNRTVLLTGHTGFKGSWLSLWLERLGAQVHGLALPPPASPCLHEVIPEQALASSSFCDTRDAGNVAEIIRQVKPDIVFHLAAQPIVRLSYEEPIDTLSTNVMGTANVLEGIRQAGLPCTTVCITSDKCYENQEWEFSYRETDPMGGHDVYSMSKGAMELLVSSWNRSFFLTDPRLGHLVTVRAGNVIGGGDYASDRIVPDSVRALAAGEPIHVRHPEAVRPWQHVLECLSGYLWLGARLADEAKGSPLATPFNFGPEPDTRQTVRRLIEEVLQHWPGEWEDGSDPESVHEAKLLTLTTEKAAMLLQWKPTWRFEETIRQTIRWYRERHALGNDDMYRFTLTQIDEYCTLAREQGVTWAQAA